MSDPEGSAGDTRGGSTKPIGPRAAARRGAPAGITLEHTLVGHEEPVLALAWSPDLRTLASGAQDGAVRLWDTRRGRLHRMFSTGARAVTSLAWSPDKKLLAAASARRVLKLFEAWTGVPKRQLKGHTDGVVAVAWSPRGLLASASDDHTVRLWDGGVGAAGTLDGHDKAVTALAWSHDDRILCSASLDGTVWGYDGKNGRTWLASWTRAAPLAVAASFATCAVGLADGTIEVVHPSVENLQPSAAIQLEGHTGPVGALAFSSDGRLLASRSHDGTLRLWRTDRWELVATLDDESTGSLPMALAFHPAEPLLAATGEGERAVRLWRIDVDALLAARPPAATVHYANAKVVLVGDAGVGKSALGLVLCGQPYQATESSHGRKVWSLSETDVVRAGRAETREVLLWDLAGQPGYRVFHRHHLNEVAVALVLFDSRSEVEPFAGVSFWARALDEARREFPLVKLLVAARGDRGGPQVSRGRIEEVARRFGFAGFFETSARSGTGVAELRAAIDAAIDWERLPRVSTPRLFHEMRQLVLDEREAERVLPRAGELLDRFRAAHPRADATRDSFATCLGRVEAAGLVKRFGFGELVLLRPEMLDDYLGWLALAARDEPDGLGFLAEHRARTGDFQMDAARLLKGREEEQLLLTATVEDVIGRGIALRQPTSSGEMLVFPSETKGGLADYPGSYVRAVAFAFEGPVRAIHATLAVALAHAPAFEKERFYQDAAVFRSAADEVCGFAVDRPDPLNDARGHLTVFFDRDASLATKLTFLRYVNHQLSEMTLRGSLERERIYQCVCGYLIPRDAVELRRAAGEKTAICPSCGRRPPIDDLAAQVSHLDRAVEEQLADAAAERARQMRLAVLDQRERGAEFHVFLCHNSKDKPEVRKLAAALRAQGILPWLDESALTPGDPVFRTLEQTLSEARAVAVCIGPHPLGRWQEFEYGGSFQRMVEEPDGRKPRVIPVLLPGAAPLPLFLRGIHWVDLRGGVDGADARDALRKLVEGILKG